MSVSTKVEYWTPWLKKKQFLFQQISDKTTSKRKKFNLNIFLRAKDPFTFLYLVCIKQLGVKFLVCLRVFYSFVSRNILKRHLGHKFQQNGNENQLVMQTVPLLYK